MSSGTIGWPKHTITADLTISAVQRKKPKSSSFGGASVARDAGALFESLEAITATGRSLRRVHRSASAAHCSALTGDTTRTR